MRRSRLLLLAGCLALASCKDSSAGCDELDDLLVVPEPANVQLNIGDSFTPTVTAYGCGARTLPADTYRWRAQDTTIVSVDLTTGRTTGRAAGRTLVVPIGTRYGQGGGIGVTVGQP